MVGESSKGRWLGGIVAVGAGNGLKKQIIITRVQNFLDSVSMACSIRQPLVFNQAGFQLYLLF